MKKILIIMACLIATGYFALRLSLALRIKGKWDLLRHDLAPAHTIVPMDLSAEAFLKDVRSNWHAQCDSINGPDAEAVQLVGYRPTVFNFIRLQTYQLPDFSWLSMRQNRKAVLMATLRAQVGVNAVDGKIHVAQDGHLAYFQCHTNVVYVFNDETNGLRAMLYHHKK